VAAALLFFLTHDVHCTLHKCDLIRVVSQRTFIHSDSTFMWLQANLPWLAHANGATMYVRILHVDRHCAPRTFLYTLLGAAAINHVDSMYVYHATPGL
jgi:hypothetical protein